ncbi:MAG: glucose-6-phosphate isomerase [Campylobacteraceae bacterium 4484_4]|nr:MAG: glucose-6-phosphate isomerase [Campylobacteraceae bacterium 4484_4]
MIRQELFFDTKRPDADLYDRLAREARSGEVGYYRLPEDPQGVCDEIAAYIEKDDIKSCRTIVVVGIGGSSLGTKAIDRLLFHTSNRNKKRLLFLENVDPIEQQSIMKGLKLDESLFIIISKSGSTIETTSHFKYLLEHFNLSFEDERFKRQFVFITDSGSPLDRFGAKYGLKVFHIPHNVGGRFSVLSAVGLLPLALVGYDIKALLSGAKTLKDSFFAKNEDLMVKKAHYYATHAGQYPINVLFSYGSAFEEFNAWYVQLWAESLGKIDKNGERRGLTPVGLIGSVDQHSFLQLIIEGPKNKTVTMIKIEDFETDPKIPDISLPYLEKTDYINGHGFGELLGAQCDATMQSIVDQGVSVDRLVIERLDEKSAGYLIFYYELLTSLTGALLEVNTYDQPGVELGKQILKSKFS